MNSIRRYTPLTLGALSQLVAILLPQAMVKRMALPWWPWLVLFLAPLALGSTALIQYGWLHLRNADGEMDIRMRSSWLRTLAGTSLHALAIIVPSLAHQHLGLPFWACLLFLGLPVEIVALALLRKGMRDLRKAAVPPLDEVQPRS